MPSSLPPNPIVAQRSADLFSWQEFLALNWPVKPGERGVPDDKRPITADGARVWETWKESYEIFRPNGAEPAPISIAPAEDKIWEAPAGGKLEIPLRITRRGEFGEALKLKAAGIAAIDALKEIDVAPKDTSVTATIDLKALKIPAGTHTIFFCAQTKGKYAKKDTTMTVYSSPIRISVQ